MGRSLALAAPRKSKVTEAPRNSKMQRREGGRYAFPESLFLLIVGCFSRCSSAQSVNTMHPPEIDAHRRRKTGIG
jgi:hypothetical protein